MTANQQPSDLDYARTVLRSEANAVLALAERLDDGFFAATDAVHDCAGRVVVCGMGKAGIMGMKLSASLASTGTPSIFLHPAEAIHGDLGRIVPEDVAIVISNSGESEEIVRLLPHIRRLGVTLIGLTGNRDSALGRESDMIMDIGVITEACPHELAPTTSTAAMHAIGDALTLLVMRRRGFSRERYAMNHPGGSLGRKLMRVKDVMHGEDSCVLATPDETLRAVLIRITKAGVGAVLVHEPADKKLVGIFTDGDIRRRITDPNLSDILDASIEDMMTRDPKTISPEAFALEALALMEKHRIGDLPVTDESGNILGAVYLKDLVELSF